MGGPGEPAVSPRGATDDDWLRAAYGEPPEIEQPPESEPPLLRAVADAEPVVNSAAARSAGGQDRGGPSQATALVALAEEGYTFGRDTAGAAFALPRGGPPIVRPLQDRSLTREAIDPLLGGIGRRVPPIQLDTQLVGPVLSVVRSPTGFLGAMALRLIHHALRLPDHQLPSSGSTHFQGSEEHAPRTGAGSVRTGNVGTRSRE